MKGGSKIFQSYFDSISSIMSGKTKGENLNFIDKKEWLKRNFFERFYSSYKIKKDCWERIFKDDRIAVKGVIPNREYMKLTNVSYYLKHKDEYSIMNGIRAISICSNKKCINPEHLRLENFNESIAYSFKVKNLENKKENNFPTMISVSDYLKISSTTFRRWMKKAIPEVPTKITVDYIDYEVIKFIEN